MNPYDLIVIGAGPGGYIAAIKAAQLKRKVAIIEQEEVGGTCLNRGCVPTKTLLHTADLFRKLTHGNELGIDAKEVTVNFDVLNQRKDTVISDLRAGIETLLKANGIDYIRGTASIQSSTTVLVNDTIYSTEHLLIATGSSPSKPSIPGMELAGIMTSDDLLADVSKFNHIVIIGGGVIGVEFATFYNSIGCEVTILEAMDRILPTMDREISQNLSLILKKRGVTIFTSTKVERIEKTELFDCFYTSKQGANHISADGLLVATGRRANTQGLGLENIQLQTIKGQIPVNERFETSVPGVYAIGDVIADSKALAHAASAQGINAVSMMFGQTAPHDLNSIPACIYTSPEIACVGITADEAKANGITVKLGKAIMSANCKSMIEMADRGFIKLVFDANTEVLLGAQLMCIHATDMIGELATAIANQQTAEQLNRSVRAHPTFNEAIGEAVADALGDALLTVPRRNNLV